MGGGHIYERLKNNFTLMKKILIFYLFLLSFQTSFAQNSIQSDLVILDLEEAFSRREGVPLSKLLNSVEYVVLETNPQSIIGKFAQYDVTDEYIIVCDQNTTNQILLFDRKTGKFIKSVGNYGRGLQEYMRFSYIPYDPDKRFYTHLIHNGTCWLLVYWMVMLRQLRHPISMDLIWDLIS